MEHDHKARIGASRLGVTLQEYAAKLGAGLKWCGFGRHWLPRAEFGLNWSTTEGLSADCRNCRSKRAARYRAANRARHAAAASHTELSQ